MEFLFSLCRALFHGSAILIIGLSGWTLGPPAWSQACAPRGLEIDRPLVTREGCAAWRWVGRRSDPSRACPQPTGGRAGSWQVRPLFEPSPSRTPPPILLPYCLYQADDVSPSLLPTLNRRLRTLLRRGELTSLSASCAAVTAMAGDRGLGGLDPSSAAWQSWRGHFLAQSEALSAQISSFEMPFEPGLKVRIGILDTQPGKKNGLLHPTPTSPHGLSLVRLLEDLTCVDGRCAAEIEPRLALPISEFDWQDPGATEIDPTNGGLFGTIDQLAESLWSLLRQPRRDGEKLILNFSVAWAGEIWGGLEASPGEMSDPIRSLFDALRVASCDGALSIAAAGNRLGGPKDEYGPLLPAGWERHEAPGPAECVDLLGHGPGYARSARFPEPLIYAASGIRGDGSRLPNTRPGSESARVGFGDHVVVGGEIFTGSSISALLVSGAAAVAWSHLPHASAGDVMRVIESGGRSLGRSAEFHRGQMAPGIRRIGICTALAAALDPACSGSDVGPSPDPCPYVCEPPSPYLLHYSEIPCRGARKDFADLSANLPLDPFCGLSSVTFDPSLGPPENPCPYRQFFGIQTRPWVGTQPQSNPCSGCDIRPPPSQNGDEPETYELRIDIDDDWAKGSSRAGTLSSIMLAIGDEGYALGFDLEAGECAVVQGIDGDLIRARNGLRPAIRLHFTTANGASVESPVFIGGFPLGEE